MPSPWTDRAPSFDELLEHFKSGRPTVGVIGLGYVGLPLCNAFHKAGCEVLGFDVDQAKIDKLKRGESYLQYTDPTMHERLSESDLFEATSDFARLQEVDAIFICVPTPLGKHREPDLSYVATTSSTIGAHLRPGQLVVLESTTYPGTTREVVLPALESGESGLVHTTDFFVAYSPEREDPGRSSHNTENTPKLVGGLDARGTALAEAIYARAVEVIHPVGSAEIAEASKILENTFRAVNIALVNELKVLMLEMGIDVFDVISAAASKPFGFMPFYPGPGLGGHCIPIDPFYLTWKAREYGVATRFVELAGEINTSMPRFVVTRVGEALNGHKKSVNGAVVLLLGLAYKKNVDDVRESPAFTVAEQLLEQGAQVQFADPYVASSGRERSGHVEIEKVELSENSLSSADVVVLLTDHDDFSYDLILEHAKLLVDTRGRFHPGESGGGHVVRA